MSRHNTLLALLATVLAVACCTRKTDFEYHVCAFVWPSCHDDSLGRTKWEKGIGEWEVIQQGTPRFPGHYQPKQPLWGYEMDNDPEVVEKWIRTALEYGVNTFIYDWYWFDHYPYLESALDDGFLKAPSNDKMEFFIMYANHNVKHNYWNYHKWGDDDSLLWDGAIDKEDWPVIVDRVITRYFSLKNYVKIDGCPVFAMFDTDNFVRSFGSVDAAKEAMEYFRSEVRKAGFPDLHYMMMCGGGPEVCEWSRKLVEKGKGFGADSWAWYNMGGFDPDYSVHCRQGKANRDAWEKILDMPLFPTVSIGWDQSPRFPEEGEGMMTQFNHTPEIFARYLQYAKDYADAHADTQPKFVMINAWNEWVEGSYLLPDKVYGYGFLEAVRKVFKSGKRAEETVVTPNKIQQEWAESEIGVMIHYDMQVFNPDYQWRQWGTHPDVSTFNPTELDTDQWLDAASKLGAKYAVLVAKHCCGFSLWPTEAHGYSVRNCPWKNGQGDIVGDFIESCKKYGIKPGLYASTTANGYYHVDNPGYVQPGSPYSQEEYNAMVEKQLTELWSNYGDLFEIWFDGGVLSREENGADVLSLVRKLQPGAIAFQGPFGHPNLIRWVGNEEGTAPDPCWATADSTTSASGTYQISGLNGHSDAPFWCPGESDFTLRHNSTRQGGWMWAPGEDEEIFTVDELMHKYETSVGHNTNMLLGIVVDPRGLVPEGDVRRMEEFGNAIREKYGNPLSSTSGNGTSLTINLKKAESIDRAVLQEDITYGERVLQYKVCGKTPSGEWVTLAKGENIGNKHILLFDKTEVEAVRLEISSYKAEPHIKSFSIY